MGQLDGKVAIVTGLFSWPQRVIARRVHAAYLRRYFQLRPERREECKAWQPIVAARLSENVPGIQPWLLATVAAGLSRYR